MISRMAEKFDGPFPADMPERERWQRPSPDHYEAERRQSGNLPIQYEDNPVRDPASPVRYRGG
jgi:hypothetical protein